MLQSQAIGFDSREDNVWVTPYMAADGKSSKKCLTSRLDVAPGLAKHRQTGGTSCVLSNERHLGSDHSESHFQLPAEPFGSSPMSHVRAQIILNRTFNCRLNLLGTLPRAHLGFRSFRIAPSITNCTFSGPSHEPHLGSDRPESHFQSKVELPRGSPMRPVWVQSFRNTLTIAGCTCCALSNEPRLCSDRYESDFQLSTEPNIDWAAWAPPTVKMACGGDSLVILLDRFHGQLVLMDGP